MNKNRNRFARVLGLVLIAGTVHAGPALAQKVNCANEFRSGKLYFSQKLFEKALQRFRVAVEACPEKGEYHARYALALSEVGNAYLHRLPTSLPEERDTLLTKGLEFIELAGREFDAALQTEEGKKKKLQKFVAQNRGHYWVDAYNEAINLIEDEDFQNAALYFRVARLLDPRDVRAYSQGAIAHIRLGEVETAIALVDSGLVVDPEDEALLSLKEKISLETARSLSRQADEEDDPVKLKQAKELYDELVAAKPDDPNLHYERGLLFLSGAGVVEQEDPAFSEELLRMAVDDFEKAAELVPADTDREFHSNCVFNIAQAYSTLGDSQNALVANKRYLCLNPLDPVGWQLMAFTLIDLEDQDGVVSALMMKKSLEGMEVPVEDAVKVASGDAKAALDALGKPDQVYTYLEDNTQIQTWLWQEERKAMVFALTDQATKNAELGWCEE